MRNNIVAKMVSVSMAVVLAAGMMTGCANKDNSSVEIAEENAPAAAQTEDAEKNDEAVADEETKQAADESKSETVDAEAGQYFTKGVYYNYAAEAENPDKTYFYVFDDDGTGHIDDGAANVGNYMEYEQGDGIVTFHIGSQDPIDEVFTVKSCENGVVTGSYEDGLELVFEPVPDADPDTFDAVNFVNAANGDAFVYTDPNGWRVKYDPELFAVNSSGPVTTFVYMGECAGTSMITVTYTIENKAEAAIKKLGENWGDGVMYHESTFPGTEDIKGYWVMSPADTEGSGLYMTAMARDYMDGALIFEMTEHHGNDDEMNMAVSDALASIVDSLEFPYENGLY